MLRPLLIALALIAMLLSACSLPPPAAQAPTSAGEAGVTRIGFAGLEPEKAMYQPLIEAFNAANPDLRVEYVPLEPAFGGDLAELARQTASAADTFLSMLAGPEAAGVAADLRPLIDADPAFGRDDFQPGALPADGPIHTLPTHIGVQTLSYNRELWEGAGLAAPAGALSWDELLGAAEQLTARRGDEVLVHGLDDGQDGRLALAGLLAEAGVSLTPGADGTLGIDGPAVAAAVERVADLLERGVLYRRTQDSGAVSFEQIGAHIREGRAAMWLGGDIAFGGPMGHEPPFAVGDVALPPLPREYALRERGYMLSAGSASPEAAWRWLSYLSREQPVAQAGMFFFGLGTEVPARRSIGERTGFWQGLSPERAAALEATLAGADRLPASDQLARGNLSAALSAAVEGQPAAQALAEAQASLDRQLAEREAQPDPEPPVVRLPDPVVVAEGATEITFGTIGPDLAALRGLAERFNAEGVGVHVTVEAPAFEGEAFALATMAERYACFAWPQPPSEDERALVRDLQPLLDGDAAIDQGDYPAGLLEPLRDGGALYGLPYAVQLRALTYNRELFAAAGLAAPRADWSDAELLEAARRLTSEAEGRYGYAVDGSHTDDLLAYLGLAGAPAVAGGAPRFTDEAVVRALESYLELLRDYSPHTTLQGYTGDGLFAATATGLGQEGRVGMWYSQGVDAVMIRVGGPERRPADLAVAPPPAGAGGLTGADFSATALMIAAGAGAPEACWEWLRFLSEQPAGLGERFPARSSVATSEAYLASARPGAAELYAAYADALAGAPGSEDPYAGVDLFWLVRAVDRALQSGDLQAELAEAQVRTEQYLACVAGGDEPAGCATAADPEYNGLGPRR